MMNRNGVHCQTSVMMSESRASQTFPKKSSGRSIMPTRMRRSLTTRPSLKASFQMKDTADGMNSIGKRKRMRQLLIQGSR